MVSLRTLVGDQSGAMAVETAIVISALLFLGLGATQASEVVTKQAQMQAAASQAEQIISATTPKTSADLTAIQGIIKTSAGLSADPTVEWMYRCGTTSTTTTTEGTCGTSIEWTYLHLRLTYTYTPAWTSYGFGSPINLVVDRMSQIS
jgi:Flp pilus assembly protein TadG